VADAYLRRTGRAPTVPNERSTIAAPWSSDDDDPGEFGLYQVPRRSPINLARALPREHRRRVIPYLALLVPAEQRSQRDDRRDLAQRLTAYSVGARGKLPPVVIG
jgi:hypothetical protein